MDSMELERDLQELQFAAHLPRATIASLAAVSTTHRVDAGKVLFREGSPNDRLYMIRRGRLALEMRVPPRGSVRILTLGPGEMVGWSAVVGEATMTATAIAMDETDLIVTPADAIQQLCEENHDFGYIFMRQMATSIARRLVVTRLQLLDVFGDGSTTPPTDSPSASGGHTSESD